MDQVGLFDTLDEAAEAEAIAKARADVKAGRVIPHDEVMHWVASWGTDNVLPRPRPKSI